MLVAGTYSVSERNFYIESGLGMAPHFKILPFRKFNKQMRSMIFGSLFFMRKSCVSGCDNFL
jgi:hypothetical protein